jgi:hypothetical protein
MAVRRDGCAGWEPSFDHVITILGFGGASDDAQA